MTNLIIDFNDPYFDNRLSMRIKQCRPDLIGFSVLTPMYNWAVKVAKKIKAEYNTPIVFGNIHASALPEYVLDNNCIDFVIRGEGEKSLTSLMDMLDKKTEEYKSVFNLCYKTKEGVVCNPLENLISDLDVLPYPDKTITRNEAPFYCDIYYCLTERGCPFNCYFCFNHFMKRLYDNKGKWVRKRSVENVIEELKIAKKQGYKFIHFDDDCFARDIDWLAKFVSLYKIHVNMPFQINSCLGNITANIARLLFEAGCISVKVGIQTTSGRILRDICNRGSDGNKIESVKNLKKYNIIVKIDTMFNLPTQSENDIVEDMRFYNRLRPNSISTYYLTYFPKTKIVDIALKYNLLTERNLWQIRSKGLKVSYIKDEKLLYFMKLMPHLPAFVVKFILNGKYWKKIPNIVYKYIHFIQLPYYISNKRRLYLTRLHVRKRIRFKYHLSRLKHMSSYIATRI